MIRDGCPTGCGRSVEAGKLMCRSCWAQVPRELGAKVNRTWRAYRNAPREERRTARYDYDLAREAAIASVA